MLTVLRRVHGLLSSCGFDGLRMVRTVAAMPLFLREALRYRGMTKHGGMPLRWSALRPMLADRFENAGVASGHYFHQDLWAARRILAARPARHVDIGSRVDGFVSHVLTFMPVEVVDVRPLTSSVPGLTFLQANATDLQGLADDSLPSVSSLHAVEHFGLGRYGDPVDPTACFRAMQSLARVLAPGGRLYFSVPIGVERVEFNAHRVFDPSTVLEEFRTLCLEGFSAVDDAGRFVADATPAQFRGAQYSCGLFEFSKPAVARP